MKQLRTGTWVVVADSEKAMILENRGDTRHVDLHQVAAMHAEPVERASDRPGRVFESMGDRSSFHEAPDIKRLNAAALVRDVMVRLERHATHGNAHPIVLVAPPQILGAMREALPEALRAHVVAELHKTLTGHPVAVIGSIVAEALAGTE